jgi:hypothetical protein
MKEELQHPFTAVGKGALQSFLLVAHAARIQSANVGQYLLPDLCVQLASAVGHTHGAVSVVSGIEKGVLLRTSAVKEP